MMVIKLIAIRNLDKGPYLILMFALIVPLYAVASKLTVKEILIFGQSVLIEPDAQNLRLV